MENLEEVVQKRRVAEVEAAKEVLLEDLEEKN
jgi:hypothetical protein